MENVAIARVLAEIGDLLEIKGENPFKVRAYRNASQVVRDNPERVAALSPAELRALPGIGKDIAGRIAELVARWIAEGMARYAIFNLKLPMKKRDDEVSRCAAIVSSRLDGAGVAHDFALRQLYHDREEVTGCIVRHGGGARDAAPSPRPAAARASRRRGASRP